MDYELAKRLKDAGFPQEGSEKYLCLSFEEIEGYGTDYVERVTTKQNRDSGQVNSGGGSFALPSLSELIAACGEGFHTLTKSPDDRGFFWVAMSPFGFQKQGMQKSVGSTPEGAVAHLWLSLNSPANEKA